jgi:hypothetical protein
VGKILDSGPQHKSINLLIERLCYMFDSSARESTPFYCGSSHSLQSKEFPHLNSEFRAPDIDGEESSSASAGRFLPHEVK